MVDVTLSRRLVWVREEGGGPRRRLLARERQLNEVGEWADGPRSRLKHKVLLGPNFENTCLLNIVGVRGGAILPLREKEIIYADMPLTIMFVGGIELLVVRGGFTAACHRREIDKHKGQRTVNDGQKPSKIRYILIVQCGLSTGQKGFFGRHNIA